MAVAMLSRLEWASAALNSNRELCVLFNGSIINIQKRSLKLSFLPFFHQATQKTRLPPEPGVEGQWEAANDVSCSSQKNVCPMKYVNN